MFRNLLFRYPEGCPRGNEVEKVILAEEVKDCNPKFLLEAQVRLPDVLVEFVTHAEFRVRTASARAVVRTGEFAPYANVILVSEVVFQEDLKSFT